MLQLHFANAAHVVLTDTSWNLRGLVLEEAVQVTDLEVDIISLPNSLDTIIVNAVSIGLETSADCS